ncbi:uncharacterized protein LOC122925568 [Bufo gargarizans]|uniref:uncharacterized protein LOC122925568 n=1 Tax=Bufo gargarizans TaxID=30331 RepID=UPI001CF24287|nr:uncharacterized protein LOC122925568 [Bufo gargarizans]
MPWSFIEPIRITTDASPWGWGAHSDGNFWQGRWDLRTRACTSNYKELKAVERVLTVAVPEVLDKRLVFYSDNSTTVAYINHQGGTKIPSLIFLCQEIFKIAEDRNLLISAVHLKGKENTVADFLSRVELSQAEWSLNGEVFSQIILKFGTPTIDLFATRRNRKTERFFSLNRTESPTAVDSLAQDWSREHGYAFPPISLIPQVLKKVRREGASIILVNFKSLIEPIWIEAIEFKNPIHLPTSDILDVCLEILFAIPDEDQIINVSFKVNDVFMPELRLNLIWGQPMRLSWCIAHRVESNGLTLGPRFTRVGRDLRDLVLDSTV